MLHLHESALPSWVVSKRRATRAHPTTRVEVPALDVEQDARRGPRRLFVTVPSPFARRGTFARSPLLPDCVRQRTDDLSFES